MHRILIFILLSIFCSANLQAQLPMLPAKDSSAIRWEGVFKQKEDSIQSKIFIFQILKSSRDTNTLGNKKPAVERKPGRIRNHNNAVPIYIVLLFIGAFVLLALLIIIDRELLTQLFACLLNPSQMIGLYNEGRFGFNFVSFALDFMFIFSLALTIQILFYPYHPEYFTWIGVLTLAAYFIKVVFIQLSAYLFFDKPVAIKHALYDLLFTRLAGLVFMPLVFCIVYQNYFGIGFLMGILMILLLTLYAIWLIIILLRMKLDGVGGIFYLLLYLCGVELFPLLIILKNYLI